jgi:hypothetical protein
MERNSLGLTSFADYKIVIEEYVGDVACSWDDS